MGLVDEDGNVVVEYSYDAWGKITSITDGNGNDISGNAGHIGNINPFRYRGYYYDAETGFYYLQSRYYNPEFGRFINTDDANMLQMAQGELLGSNLFAYCGNNPINRADPTGYLSFGKQWWNKVSFVALVVDLLIIFVPVLWSLGGAFKAKLAAEKLAKAAGKQALEKVKNRSRKKIIEMFVRTQKDMAKRGLPKLGSALKAFGGAIVEGFFTIIGKSVGEVFASLLDRLDGRKDGYIFG
ncbi:MAG: RHS repeat-associated core domain-containing protein [Oscillospiraceae bacterium]|nr:RHS repeat-associated core domain-containing protein [Oscillospiraceae bacterium]MDD4412942.1 RHS repeat-associated core domain-containing protein [Oscillospiraceae bacterium]